jgi:hypothetical protein
VRRERTQAGPVFASVRALDVWLVVALISYHAPMVEWLTEGRESDVRTPPPLRSTVPATIYTATTSTGQQALRNLAQLSNLREQNVVTSPRKSDLRTTVLTRASCNCTRQTHPLYESKYSVEKLLLMDLKGLVAKTN